MPRSSLNGLGLRTIGICTIPLLLLVGGLDLQYYFSEVALAAPHLGIPSPPWRREAPPTEEGRRSRRLPNALFVGAQKAGTSALWAELFHTGYVCGGGGWRTMKEAHFFNKHYKTNGVDYYYNLYKACDNSTPIVMDATPNYLHQAPRIYETYQKEGRADSVKIIVSLREPVSREISWYHHVLGAFYKRVGDQRYAKQIIGREDGTPMTCNEYMERKVVPKVYNNFGMYAKWLKQFFDHFPRENILILSYDEFKTDPDATLGRLYAFLELPTLTTTKKVQQRNIHPAPKNEVIPCALQQQLNGLFNTSNEELYQLLEDNPGPPMEQRPFPKFQFQCSE